MASPHAFMKPPSLEYRLRPIFPADVRIVGRPILTSRLLDYRAPAQLHRRILTFLAGARGPRASKLNKVPGAMSEIAMFRYLR